jgi:hypothetical protein
MPVELQWHSELPVLMATYTGILTPKTYTAMCDQRYAMLDDGPGPVMLLADMQALEGVRDAVSFQRDNAVLFDERVRSTLVVLPEDLYRRVMRAVNADEQQHYPVQFFSDIDSALDAVSQAIKN